MKKSFLFINLIVVIILIATPMMASGCMLKMKATKSHKITIVKKNEKNSMELFNNVVVSIERAILQNVLFKQSSIKNLFKVDDKKVFEINRKKTLDTIFKSISPKIPMC